MPTFAALLRAFAAVNGQEKGNVRI